MVSKFKGKGCFCKIFEQFMEWKVLESCGSEIESGEDNELEQEKKYCEGFSVVMYNIMLMEKEEVVICVRKLLESYNFIFLDRDNIVFEISKLSIEDKLLFILIIFCLEKESVKIDILFCS